MSFGRFLQGLAPIAAGAMTGGAGFAAWAPVAAGAATGAGIAALNNEDVLTGAAMGGMSGWGGKGIGEAMRGTATGAKGYGPVLDPDLYTPTTSTLGGGSTGTFTPTLGQGFKASIDKPGQFLSNFGDGSMGKGAARLGAVGLPAIGQGLIPEYNANPDDNPMAKYDPNRRLNLGMTTGIQNALTRDSGLRLLQGGGYLGGDDISTRTGFSNLFGLGGDRVDRSDGTEGCLDVSRCGERQVVAPIAVVGAVAGPAEAGRPVGYGVRSGHPAR